MAKFCQSCSMPMDKDPGHGGTEADGRKSEKYCALCYQDGKFLNPEFTAKQMQDFCIVQMKKQGMPGFVAWIFTRGIPNLERWKKTS
ncbi:zinc ribbon domain-containing protein [uncultured Maritalea sp.]|uniref:zinc ribbon domain-containing protein n=1 Tax=uncultured Maritalea sp. TaxID=757249 RepID=UPI002616049A|nr:zinc ribbon domain-containing protein [uncultured Maritalea sp.]